MAVKSVTTNVTRESVLSFVGKDGATHKEILDHFKDPSATLKILNELVDEKKLATRMVPDDNGRMTIGYVVSSPFKQIENLD